MNRDMKIAMAVRSACEKEVVDAIRDAERRDPDLVIDTYIHLIDLQSIINSIPVEVSREIEIEDAMMTWMDDECVGYTRHGSTCFHAGWRAKESTLQPAMEKEE